MGGARWASLPPPTFPNYYPYRFKPGEADPTGQGKVEIPYLLTMPDGTLIRIKGNGAGIQIRGNNIFAFSLSD